MMSSNDRLSAPVAAPIERASGRSSIPRSVAPLLTATIVFHASLVYYGFCLFPGLGGELNPGDSAKFQILGHAPIMLHGPGYPFVLLMASVLRALSLPISDWWALTFALSAVPGAIANTLAFLIARQVSQSTIIGLAAALLLGSAGLMVIQATEAEVYALALAFILGTAFLLMRFVQTKRLGYFLAACAVYAISFGNHLMMAMLLPMFVILTALHYRLILRPKPVAIIAGFILLGASQYLYLAYVAYSPDTSYSEYMPLPPTPMELVHYVIGTYFGNLYGSGLKSTGTLEALIATLRSAHPWISLPLITAGVLLFLAGWKRRDVQWRGLAVVFGAALSFVPFMLWYGAYDIGAFHLPVLGPVLIAAVATFGWWSRHRPVLLKTVPAVLLAIGVVRAVEPPILLSEREPMFAGLEPALAEMVAQSPVERPVVAMSYGLRMATLYHELRGEAPRAAVYRVRWRALAALRDQHNVGGIVVPTDGYQFIRWIEEEHPDMICRTSKLELPADTRWPAYAFTCLRGESGKKESHAGAAPAPQG